MLSLAIPTGLNWPNQIKTYIYGALNNGVTVEEIKEIFVNTTIYCDILAGFAPFKVASQEIDEAGAFKDIDK